MVADVVRVIVVDYDVGDHLDRDPRLMIDDYLSDELYLAEVVVGIYQ